MRVISGISKGVKLKEPDGVKIRPTTDRVKEGIFSAIQFLLSDAKVLDLFAGTGQLGIEALSRGAQLCVFVDNDKASHRLQIENLKKSKLLSKSKVVYDDSIKFINNLKDKFDIIFLDPPYNSPLLIESIELLEDKLNKCGVIVCEHLREYSMPGILNNLILKKNYKYGKIEVSIYKLKGEN